MQISGSFDANTVQPQQGATVPPPGHYPFQISNTEIVPTKDNSGGMFCVEFTTPAGTIINRYNLWNSSPQAVEIAQKQLSALCHATGIFKLDWQNEGAALRGARGTLEIGPQKSNPEYMEVKKVFDVNGNEPGKPPKSAAPQTQPQQQQANGGWGTATTQQQANGPAPQPQGWGAPPPPPQQPQQGAPSGWQQQQGGAASPPPWGGPK